MIPQISAAFAFWLLAAAALTAQAADVQETAIVDESAGMATPMRMAISVFGTSAEVEVRDLPAAEAAAAIESTLTEIFTIDRLTDPDGDEPGGVGELNRAAGKAPQSVDLRVADLLVRSLQFCIWSGGAYGPLGGGVYSLWESGEGSRPQPGDVRDAAGSAECNRLSLRSDNPDNPSSTTAVLAAGSRIDLRGIARGFAVDRAVGILEQHGARNVWVEVGNVLRARGDGPEGRGWLATLAPIPGEEEPLDRLWIQDQALAVVGIEMHEAAPGIIDQRTGVPSRGVYRVIAVTDLAVDVEPLVYALFVLGHREGHMRLGTLNPRPSVYWLLGQGVGQPLEATYRWSELERVWRR